MAGTKEVTIQSSLQGLRAKRATSRAGSHQGEKTKRAWWHSLFYGCAACIGGATGHIGCLIAPLVTTATSGATSASGHNSLVMIGTALAINSATLGVWYRLRGRFVSRPIKAATIGFALAGMVVTTGINLNNHLHNHSYEQAQAWLDAQQPEDQKRVKELASALHMSVQDYLVTFEICGTPTASPNTPATQPVLTPRERQLKPY